MANEVKLIIDGDPAGIKKASADAVAAMEGLKKAGDSLNEATSKSAGAADAHAESLKREAGEAGQGRDALLKVAEAHGQAEKAARQGAAANDLASMSFGQAAKAVFAGIASYNLASQALEKIVQIAHEVVQETEALQQSQARVQAVLRATGGASGVTSENVEALVASMAKLTRFDDTELRNAAAAVLTFGNMSEEWFGKIMHLSADLVTVYGGNLQQWAVAIAKVGTAPMESLTFLERQLQKFDVQTKVNIQSSVELGKVMDAQAALSQYLAGKVAGAAEASYKGLERQIEGTSKAWKDLEKAVGVEIFSANSRDASIFEKALVHMTDTFKSRMDAMRDAWNNLGVVGDFLLWIAGLKASAEPKYDTPMIASVMKELEDVTKARDAALQYGGDTSQLDARVRGLKAYANVLEQNYEAQKKLNDQAKQAPAQVDAKAQMSVENFLTPSTRAELRQQDLQAQQTYIDALYQQRQAEADRETALLEQQHSAGLVSEAAYFARLRALGAQKEQDDVDRVKKQIAVEEDLRRVAEGELNRVLGETSPNKAQDVVAAEKNLMDVRAALKKLTVDLGTAEAKRGQTSATVDAQQAKVDNDRAEKLLAIARAREDDEKALNRQTGDMQFQLELLGKTAEQAAVLANNHKLDLEQQDKALELTRKIKDLEDETAHTGADNTGAIAGWRKELEELPGLYGAVRDAQAEIISQTVGLQQQLSVWEELGSRASSFVESAMHGFKGLKDAAKQFFMEMLAIVEKRWVLQIGASMTGGIAGQALAAQAAQTGQGTLAGAGADAVSSGASMLGSSLGIMGSTGLISSLGGMIGGSFGAGLTFTGSAGLMEGAAAALSGTGSAAFSLGAIIPVIGWVIAVAALLYSIFGNKGGGTKMQGAFAGLFSGSGDFLSSITGAEDIANIHGTQDANNAQAQKIGQAAARGIVQGINSLGGTASAFQLSTGFSMDPAGTAPGMFHGVLRNAQGQELFRYQNDNLSRDPQEFQQQVQAALSRMMVGALQNDHTLPDAIQRWVHTIDAAAASDDDIQRIIKGAAALKSLIDETTSLSDAIKELDDPAGVQTVVDTLHNFDKAVTDAKKALDTAASSGDPTEYLAAEQAYKQAVMNRYQQEVAMVRQLQDQIRQTEEAAYQFAINIAQRLNAVGGRVDVGAIALGRANSLRSGIGSDSTSPIATQIQDLQSYVGAIDSWYDARRQAILDDAQHQADAINKANQTRTEQLQHELQLVTSMKAIIDQANAMSKDMQLSGSNPLPALARLGIAKNDVERLREQFLNAGSEDRASAAQALLQALGSERSLAESSLQRPTQAYQDIYNQIQSDLALIGKDSKSIDQQQLDLQTQIADSSKQLVDAASIAKGQLDALDGEARGYYTWAQAQGERLYKMQADAYNALLMATTGGSDPQLFIASETSRIRSLIEQLVSQNSAFLGAVGQSSGSTNTSGGGNPITRGTTGGTTPPDGGQGTGPDNPISRGSTVNFSVKIERGEDPFDAIARNLPRLRRLTKTS